jgi:hypothetical protein
LAASAVAVAALSLIALAGGRGPRPSEANHVSDTSSMWAIDADVTGNTATSLGSREGCVAAVADSDVTVDVTIQDVPVVNINDPVDPNDTTGGMIAFAFTLVYPAPEVSVEAAAAGFLLGSMPGSSVLAAGEETQLPDTNGSFGANVLDTGVIPGSTESGEGVLERLTVHVGAAGLYSLTFAGDSVAHVDAQNLSRPAPVVYSAQIAVGQPCPGPAVMGDVDCSGGVNAVDALKVLRSGAALLVSQTEPCNNIGSQQPANGDVDCSGATNSVDALKLLRFASALGYTKVHMCEDIGG